MNKRVFFLIGLLLFLVLISACTTTRVIPLINNIINNTYINGSVGNLSINSSFQCSNISSRMYNISLTNNVLSGLCGNDVGGNGTSVDLNNYTTAILFSGTSTKTLTLNRTGMSSLTASFTDLNYYPTGVSVVGTTTKNLQISRSGTTNISASFTDIDTNDTTNLNIEISNRLSNDTRINNSLNSLGNWSADKVSYNKTSELDLLYYSRDNKDNFTNESYWNKTSGYIYSKDGSDTVKILADQYLLFGNFPTYYGALKYDASTDGLRYSGQTFYFDNKFSTHEYYLADGYGTNLDVTNYGGMSVYEDDMTLTSTGDFTLRPQPSTNKLYADLGMVDYNWRDLYLHHSIYFYDFNGAGGGSVLQNEINGNTANLQLTSSNGNVIISNPSGVTSISNDLSIGGNLTFSDGSSTNHAGNLSGSGTNRYVAIWKDNNLSEWKNFSTNQNASFSIEQEKNLVFRVNATAPYFIVQNTGGNGGAGFQFIDSLSNSNFNFKAVSTGGFKIHDNTYPLDPFIIENNASNNAIYIRGTTSGYNGYVGFNTIVPTARIDVNGTLRATGNITFTNLTGTGNALVCVNSLGVLYRGNATSC